MISRRGVLAGLLSTAAIPVVAPLASAVVRGEWVDATGEWLIKTWQSPNYNELAVITRNVMLPRLKVQVFKEFPTWSMLADAD